MANESEALFKAGLEFDPSQAVQAISKLQAVIDSLGEEHAAAGGRGESYDIVGKLNQMKREHAQAFRQSGSTNDPASRDIYNQGQRMMTEAIKAFTDGLKAGAAQGQRQVREATRRVEPVEQRDPNLYSRNVSGRPVYRGRFVSEEEFRQAQLRGAGGGPGGNYPRPPVAVPAGQPPDKDRVQLAVEAKQAAADLMEELSGTKEYAQALNRLQAATADLAKARVEELTDEQARSRAAGDLATRTERDRLASLREGMAGPEEVTARAGAVTAGKGFTVAADIENLRAIASNEDGILDKLIEQRALRDQITETIRKQADASRGVAAGGGGGGGRPGGFFADLRHAAQLGVGGYRRYGRLGPGADEGGLLTSLGGGLFTGGAFTAFYALQSGVANAVRQAVQLDRQMANVKDTVQSLGQGSQFPQMRNDLLGISDATGVAGSDVAQLSQIFLGLTGNVQTATTATKAAAEYIEVTGENAQQAGVEISTIMQSMGVSAEQAASASIAAARVAGRTPQDIQAGVANIAPVGQLLGLAPNQQYGLIAAAEKGSSLSGEQIGQSVSRILEGFQNNLPKLSAYGVNFQQPANYRQDLLDLVKALQPGQLPQANRIALTEALGGPRNVQALAALGGPQATAILQGNYTGSGALQQRVASVSQTTAESLRQLGQSAQTFVNEVLNSGLGTVLSDIARSAGALLHGLGDLASLVTRVDDAMGGVPLRLIELAAGVLVLSRILMAGRNMGQVVIDKATDRLKGVGGAAKETGPEQVENKERQTVIQSLQRFWEALQAATKAVQENATATGANTTSEELNTTATGENTVGEEANTVATGENAVAQGAGGGGGLLARGLRGLLPDVTEAGTTALPVAGALAVPLIAAGATALSVKNLFDQGKGTGPGADLAENPLALSYYQTLAQGQAAQREAARKANPPPTPAQRKQAAEAAQQHQQDLVAQAYADAAKGQAATPEELKALANTTPYQGLANLPKGAFQGLQNLDLSKLPSSAQAWANLATGLGKPGEARQILAAGGGAAAVPAVPQAPWAGAPILPPKTNFATVSDAMSAFQVGTITWAQEVQAANTAIKNTTDPLQALAQSIQQFQAGSQLAASRISAVGQYGQTVGGLTPQQTLAGTANQFVKESLNKALTPQDAKAAADNIAQMVSSANDFYVQNLQATGTGAGFGTNILGALQGPGQGVSTQAAEFANRAIAQSLGLPMNLQGLAEEKQMGVGYQIQGGRGVSQFSPQQISSGVQQYVSIAQANTQTAVAQAQARYASQTETNQIQMTGDQAVLTNLQQEQQLLGSKVNLQPEITAAAGKVAQDQTNIENTRLSNIQSYASYTSALQFQDPVAQAQTTLASANSQAAAMGTSIAALQARPWDTLSEQAKTALNTWAQGQSQMFQAISSSTQNQIGLLQSANLANPLAGAMQSVNALNAEIQKQFGSQGNLQAQAAAGNQGAIQLLTQQNQQNFQVFQNQQQGIQSFWQSQSQAASASGDAVKSAQDTLTGAQQALANFQRVHPEAANMANAQYSQLVGAVSQAQGQVFQAQQQSIQAFWSAQASSAMVSGNAIAAAQDTLNGANQALANFVRLHPQEATMANAEYAQLVQQVNQAQAGAIQAQLAQIQSVGDVVASQIALTGNTPAVAQAQLATAKQKLAAFQQRFPHATIQNSQTLAQLVQQVNQAQANVLDQTISYTENQISELIATNQLSIGQGINQLRALQAKAKAAGDQAQVLAIQATIQQYINQGNENAQFNLPTNLNLPTLYEVRRTEATPKNANYYGNQGTVNVSINISNQTDVQPAVNALMQAVGGPPTSGLNLPY